MHDSKGRLTIPGINNSKKFTRDILENNEKIPFSQKEFGKITGAKRRHGNSQVDFYTQTGFLTSAETTTLNGGYMGEGYRNAIPGSAVAKINFRLAPGLKAQEAIKVFAKFVKENLPDYVAYDITADQHADGFFVNPNSEPANRAKKLLARTYKTEVYDRPCGAIIPIVGLFMKYLKVPVVSVGLANEDCNMHGANENFRKDVLKKGLEFSRQFFSK